MRCSRLLHKAGLANRGLLTVWLASACGGVCMGVHAWAFMGCCLLLPPGTRAPVHAWALLAVGAPVQSRVHISMHWCPRPGGAEMVCPGCRRVSCRFEPQAQNNGARLTPTAPPDSTACSRFTRRNLRRPGTAKEGGNRPNKEKLQSTRTTVDRHHSQIMHRAPPQNEPTSQ